MTPKTAQQHKRRPARQGGKPKLKIIPLGGMEEVGKNMTIFEYGSDIILLDMGLKFPEEDEHGIDYIIPNISYLKGKEKNVRAVIFSHGHLDHIGASPILLDKLGYPTIVGRPMTLEMVKHRQEDYRPKSSNRLKIITIKKLSDQFSFGAFRVRFFQVEHSVMDAVGVILETPAGSVIHPGDWTLERDSRTGNPIVDYRHLARVRKPSILMLESLGAIDVRKSATQDEMKKNLETLIKNAPGRIIIGTFASQIERIGWIIGAAEREGKKVALDGYSMKMNVEIANRLGYIKAKKGTLIKISQIDDYPDRKIIVIATGAQGEGNAVLSRIITGTHKNVRL
ncbi:MAG: ribonuclease J, partial [Patescibacteria group bacterium]